MQTRRDRAGDAPNSSYALIGLGAIGSTVAELARTLPDSPALLAALVRASDPRLSNEQGIHCVATLEELIARRPGVIVETARQAAVRQYARSVLDAGVDLMLISVGALTDDALRMELIAAGQKSGARIIVPAGATGGLDVLGAMAHQGLEEVSYVSTKPCAAWRGTVAETTHDLDRLQSPTVIFEGSARAAASAFPRNANLAATIALAGVGLDRTRVTLVADPAAAGNSNRIVARGSAGQLQVEVSGPAMTDNPKSSRLTALSIANALRNRCATLII